MDTTVSMVQRTANVFVMLKGAMKNVPNLVHTTYLLIWFYSSTFQQQLVRPLDIQAFK